MTFCRACSGAELVPLWAGWHRCLICGCESNGSTRLTPAREYPEHQAADAEWFAQHKAQDNDFTALILGSGKGSMLAEMQGRGWSIHGFDERPECNLGDHTTIAPFFHAGLFPRRYAAVYDRGGLSRSPGWRQRLAELALACRLAPKGGMLQLHAGRPAGDGSAPVYNDGHSQLFLPVALKAELPAVGLEVVEERLSPGWLGLMCRFRS